MPQFWKQFINNPKSASSDSITLPSRKNPDPINSNPSTSIPSVTKPFAITTTTTTTNTPTSPSKTKPILSTSLNSFNTSSNHHKLNSNSVTTPTDDYKLYRDTFLNNKNGFNGRVFGVSLSDSLSVASAEVIVQSELVSFGRIPIVVAKCGAFLKANGLETSGIFRIAGNSKRVKQLQYIFSHGPDYGSKFNNWDGYSVHDVASLLRRFLNNLQEPLIPLSLYEDFRDPLRNKPRILKYMMSHNASYSNTDKIKSLPSDSGKDGNVVMKNVDRNIDNEVSTDQKKPSLPSETTNTNNIPETNMNKENITDRSIAIEGQLAKNSDRQEETTTKNNNNDTVPKERKQNGNENESDVDEEELRRRKRLRHRKKLSRDIRAALKEYETLFVRLNNDTKQLTIYLLDLLSLFARQSQLNLMSARNLAAIFQPSFLSHPKHDMDPKEYELSRFVVEFLIEYSYKLLPHLLKIAKKEQQERSNNKIKNHTNNNTNNNNAESQTNTKLASKQFSSPLKNNITPPKVTFNDSEIDKAPPDLIKSKQPSVKRSSSSLKPSPAPSQTQRPQRSKSMIRRPHSRSIGSVPTPPDMIVSNRRKTTLFPWLHKPGFLSDAGDSTTTEIEDADDDFDDDNNSPTMNTSTNKNILTVPPNNRTLSGNSTSSSGFRINGSNINSNRPMSMILNNVVNKSTDEVLEYSSSNEDANIGSTSKARRRESWFQRFTR